jgi:hypothetical protein
MANTYTLIASSTVGSGGASNITFSSIPSTYTDLIIKFSGRLSVEDVDNIITLNTSTNKTSSIRIYGNGSNFASDTAVGGGLANPSTYTANVFGNTEYYFTNYLSSVNKTVSIDAVNENNSTQAYTNLSTQLFTLGSAITEIKLTPNSGSYVQYTTAYLYGIKNS